MKILRTVHLFKSAEGQNKGRPFYPFKFIKCKIQCKKVGINPFTWYIGKFPRNKKKVNYKLFI